MGGGGGGGGGGIPFHVIGRKYTEGTNSRPHAYNTLSVLYIEGEAWQEPLQENRVTQFKNVLYYLYNTVTIKQGSK